MIIVSVHVRYFSFFSLFSYVRLRQVTPGYIRLCQVTSVYVGGTGRGARQFTNLSSKEIQIVSTEFYPKYLANIDRIGKLNKIIK